MKKGIDISEWQGSIDFSSVKNDGIEFLIMREGFRNSIDARFLENVKKAKESGIDVLAVYHFSYALNEDQARTEARSCINNMKNAGLGPEVLVFFDFEYDTVSSAAKNGITLKQPECNAHTVAFCEEVKKLGYTPGIYTNLDYYKNWYYKDVLSKYQIWLADYTGDPDFACIIQQYSNKGRVAGINGDVDMNYFYDDKFKMNVNTPFIYSRYKVVDLVESWLGKNEADGSHKEIIDIYNTCKNLPRGTKMLYNWAWCACTWSALAIKLGYTDIMPIEISCGKLIDNAKAMGCWQEDDAYVPAIGDAILYNWDDDGIGDNTGGPDHVGTITYVNRDAGYMEVVEGNYNKAVKKRTISLNGRYIRGFITPKYNDTATSSISIDTTRKDTHTIALEVIAGKWGNGDARKNALSNAGYNYTDVQSIVNQILNGSATTPKQQEQDQIQPVSKKVVATCAAHKFDRALTGTYTTTDALYCRNDAGTNKKALCLIPKGTKVNCYGYYNISNGIKWLYIQFTMDGIQYTGFSSSQYLKR